MIKQFKYLIIISLVSLAISSCVTNKKYIYLQDKGHTSKDSSGFLKVVTTDYRLQKKDILYISLSTEDERMNKVFVPGVGVATPTVQNQYSVGTLFYYIGFTINDSGCVELPYVGNIHVEGLTLEFAKLKLESELKKYFKVFHLQVKIAEFKFSVLGFVNRPGQYFFQQNKVNIFEAISLAGDLQNMAKRFELQLIRQYPEGTRIHVLDLTDQNIINSPYYFLQPNDVLYVVPLKGREIGDLSSLQSTFGVIAPLLSTLLIVINTYILVKNL